MSKECSPRITQTIPSPDPSCPLLSRHQLRVFAVLSKPGCTHVQRERSPEPSPKRDAAGVSRSLLFHPPFLHIVRTRVPPRVQRPQAEPEPVTPGCNEGRGARNLSRGRNTIAILSGPGPNQQRHPGWGRSIRGGPLPAEAGSAHAPPTSGSGPRAGVPLGTLQDGGPHGAVWDAPGSENSYGSPFPGRLVATALEGRLHWAPQCAVH